MSNYCHECKGRQDIIEQLRAELEAARAEIANLKDKLAQAVALIETKGGGK